MSNKPGIIFKSKFHKKIYLLSSDWVFEMGEREVEFLGANPKKIISIGGFFFQLVKIPRRGYLFFKLPEKMREQKRFFEFRGDDFYLRGHKANVQPISLLDFEEDNSKVSIGREEMEEALMFHQIFVAREKEKRHEMMEGIPAPVNSEEIHVEEVGLAEAEPAPEEEVEPFTSRSMEEMVAKSEDVLRGKKTPSNVHRNSDLRINPQDTVFENPVDLNKKGSLWFTLDRDFENTDEFWRELREYYKNNPIDDGAELPPVFARKDASINLPKFHEVFLKKMSDRVEQLASKKQEIEKDLRVLEDGLIERGVVPDGDANYQELLGTKKNMSECLERAKKALAEYEEDSRHFESEAKKTIEDRFFLDIHGQPTLVSKYHEFITLKLMDLNREINFLHRRHLELEHLLIKRLKDIEAAKDAKSKIIKLEQEELMEAFREDNQEFFAEVNARRRKDVLEKMGEIHESTAEIQRHIEEEKRKIKYYMDNLEDLGRYEKFDTSLFQYKKRKQNFRRQTDEFNRYVYKLKMMVEDRERRFREFFEGTRREILDFQREITKIFGDTDSLARNSLSSLWDLWEQEAGPCIRILSTRSAQIIDAFSFVPATQIKRIYRFKRRLREEALKRQAEWDRIYEEIRQEFKKSGYELLNPLPSELDGKYIKKLEEANLRLSDATKAILFIPPSKFSLATQRDVTIGLDPKLLDDDRFVVIDQVWTTLTPEQEKKLQNTLKLENQKKRFESSVNSLNHLKREQMKEMRERWRPKRTSMEIHSRPISSSEKFERMRAIEEAELRMMKRDHYLFSNTVGEFKDLLYNISKRLFQSKSMRMVNRDIRLTDDGLVNDGGTEIFTEQDYFIKSPDTTIFREISDDIDLSQDEAVFDEPSEEILEYISDPEHVGQMARPEESGPSPVPTMGDMVKMGAGKLKTLREKRLYELSLLREKMLTMDEEVEKLKDYHENQTKTLEIVLSDRAEIFEDMRSDIEAMKGFLSEKENELESIISRTEEELEISLEEINESLFRQPEPMGIKKNFSRWFGRAMGGEGERGGK